MCSCSILERGKVGVRGRKEKEKGSNRMLGGQEKDRVESLVTIRALLVQQAKSQIIRLLLSVKT